MVGSSETAAEVQAYRSPLGQRLVVRGRIGELAALHPDADVVARRRPGRLRHHDRRLRRRRPTAAAALAVSGAGRHAGQRSRRRGGRSWFCVAAQPHTDSESVDTADHPWTLDNPAYGWFGLSSAARVRVGDGGAMRCRWPRWSPRPRPTGGRLARDLVVALVRAGVTATCSSADRPRYGLLGVDSNLPDTRIALGGPIRTRLPRSVLAAADPAYTREVERQLADDRPGHGVGARRRAVGGRLDSRRRPAGLAGAAGAGDRRARRRAPGQGDRVGGRRPRRRRDRRQAARPVGAAATSNRARSHCATAECPASPSRPTARCTPR